MKNNIAVNYGKNNNIAIAGENIRNQERFEKYARKMRAMEKEIQKRNEAENRMEAVFSK